MGVFRNILLNSIEGLLPFEYQHVEYIEGTGTQYIDTGVLTKSTLEIQADMQLTNNAYQSYCGASSSVSDTQKRFFLMGYRYRTTDRVYGYIGTSTWPYTDVPTNFVFSRHVVGAKLVNSKPQIFLDGVAVTTIQQGSTTSGYFEGDQSILILNFKGPNGPDNPAATGKVYGLKIYDNDVLIRDFIPCYRKRDSHVGLYDLVGKTFYDNAGSGVFLKGNNINDN